jgi:hypothetical protein
VNHDGPRVEELFHEALALTGRERADFLELLSLARVGFRTLALDLPLVLVVHRQRQLAREQVVARVAAGDPDDLAAPAEMLDMVLENDFDGHKNS